MVKIKFLLDSLKIDIQGVALMADQSNPPLNPLYFGFFLMFCAFLIIKYGQFFIQVFLGHMVEKKKTEKSHPQKRQVSGVAQNGSFLALQNFEGCQLCIQLSN